MPVQFRCSLCRKKLKVSRRKSGTQVACPNCLGTTSVPTSADMDAELDQLLNKAGGASVVQAPPKTKTKKVTKTQPKLDDLPLFERDDFVEMLDQDDDDGALEPTTTPTKESPSQSVVDADAVVISRSTITMCVIAVLSLLGLAFAAGFLVGSR